MTAPGRDVPSEPVAFRRLICVSANPSIDKVVAVERVIPGEIHRPDVLSMLPGGKAINVARPARRLGVPVSVVAMLAGHAGDWIEDELAARHIPVRRVTVQGESRTCLSILDRSTGRLTEFYEPGVAVDGVTWAQLEDAVAREVGGGDPSLVVLSGSLPAGAPVDGYERLARVTAEAGMAAGVGSLVAVDVGGAQLGAALQARPWLVKVNAAEARTATAIETGDEEGSVRAANALRAAGASLAIITRGVEAAIVAAGAGCWRIGPSCERGSFPVGSGDAFLAAFAAGIMDGNEPPEAARRAFAVAAAHALVPGQGEFRLEDVERIRPAIQLARCG